MNIAANEQKYTYQQWKAIECERKLHLEYIKTKKRIEKAERRKYFIKQKTSGVILLAISLFIQLFANNATFTVLLLPLSLYLIFTNNKVMTFSGWEEE